MNAEKTVESPQAGADKPQPVVGCHMIPQVTVEAKIEAEFPNLFRNRWRTYTVEKQAEMLEDACKDFEAFIRDHRSQDPVRLDVVRVKKDLCSNCENEWEPMEENGKTYCAHCGMEIISANNTPQRMARPSAGATYAGGDGSDGVQHG